MKTKTFPLRSAFTLVELMVGMTIGLFVSALALSYIQTSAILLIKNITSNQSNNEVRNALDQIGDHIHSALTMPSLIDTNGNVRSSLPSAGKTGDSLPAAGVSYDRLLGDPYVLTYPGGSGLKASDSSVTVTRSLSIYASTPIPVKGDILLIESASSTVRARIDTVIRGAGDGKLEPINLTLESALGSGINWSNSQPKLARLIRHEALLVMPVSGHLELRRYPLSLDYPKNYHVITRYIGGRTSEATPFFVTTTNTLGDKLFKLDLRVRVTGFENVLARKEANDFSNFMRVQTAIPVRNKSK